MTTGAPLVEVEHLVVEFRTGGGFLQQPLVVRAVDGVSFNVARGETLGLVGESGSGKTTLGRAILRLVTATAGAVRFDGMNVLELDAPALRALRRQMQIVFQDPYGSLNPRMTVGAAVREPITVHRLARGVEAEARVAALFKEVGLDASFVSAYPHELSGGQRQRVGIARALSVGPEFVVLDEPVSALDVSVQAQVLNLLADLRDRHGLTYLFIAHDLAVVRHLATRVAVMYLGKLVEVAPAEELYANPLHPYTASLLAAVPAPEPAVHRKPLVVVGEATTVTKPAAGCPFEPRCPHPKKDEHCRAEAPAWHKVETGRWAACHYVEEPLRPA